MQITAQQIADKAARILGQPITARVVEEVFNARRQLEAMAGAQPNPKLRHWGDLIRCVCGCGKTFVRTGTNAKIHPDCRQRVYRDRGLMALCKPRVPEVVQCAT